MVYKAPPYFGLSLLRTLGATMGLILVITPVLGGQEQESTRSERPAQRQVLDASGKWFEALMAGDVETLNRLQTEDFLTVQQAPGVVAIVGKPQQMENLLKNTKTRPRFTRELSSIRVREYGSVAVLTGLATFRQAGPSTGRAATQAVITEIWVKDGERWRIAHFQPTDVPPKMPR